MFVALLFFLVSVAAVQSDDQYVTGTVKSVKMSSTKVRTKYFFLYHKINKE